jgi:hypothetical protein
VTRRSQRAFAAVLVAAGTVAALAASGCSTILGIESDRHLVASDGGAGADADASPGPWDCLQSAGSGPQSLAPLALSLIVMDGLQPEVAAGSVDGGSDLETVSGAYLPGISVRSCALLDPDCVSGSTPVVTDDAGLAQMSVAGTFSGFFRLSGPMGTEQAVPVNLYPGRLLASDQGTRLPAYELSPDGIQTLAITITTTPLSLDPDGGVGHVLANVYDCQDHQAAGVVLHLDTTGAETQAFYFKDSVPNSSATQTDSFGLGGAINVPVGTQTLSASIADGGASLGTTTITVHAGQVTWAWLRVRSR